MAVSDGQYEWARAALPASVRLIELSTDDAWLRDTGPTFVVDGKGARRGVDWRFNAWGGLEGGLYFPWDRDERVASKVLEVEGDPRYAAPLVPEGGSIHVDGEGTLIATEECLLNPNRNPELSREELETVLFEYLGVRKVVWLGRGVFNDETDGHVDNLACFVRPGVVALHWTDDRSDPQYAVSADALRRLRLARDSRGRAIEVIKLPMPGPLELAATEAAGILHSEYAHRREAGMRLAASYVNFYIANRGIVMPLLDRRTDRLAAARLKRARP